MTFRMKKNSVPFLSFALLFAGCEGATNPKTKGQKKIEDPAGISLIDATTLSASIGVKKLENAESLSYQGMSNSEQYDQGKGGIIFNIAGDLEKDISGNAIDIKLALGDATTVNAVKIIYVTREVGNSGWKEFQVNDGQIIDFSYKVPQMKDGNGDRLILLPHFQPGSNRIEIESANLEINASPK